MKKLLFLLIWIFFAISCESPNEDTPNEDVPNKDTPSGFGEVDGYLWFKNETNPLQGYLIKIAGISSSVTDAKGYFCISKIPEGPQKLEVWLGAKLVYWANIRILSDIKIPIMLPILAKKGDFPDFSVVDISGSSDWDYWVVGKEEYFYIKVKNSLPAYVLYHHNNGKNYGITFDERGFPKQLSAGDFIVLYGNFTANTVDIGILTPTGETQIIRGIPVDFSWAKFDKSIQSKADIIKWTGRVVGAIPCVALGASVLVSAGTIVPLDLLAAWTCGNYFVKMTANFLDDRDIENGFTEFVDNYRLQSTFYTCAVVPDPASCLVSLASEGMKAYEDYVEEIEFREADLRRMQEMINSNVPLKEVTFQLGPEGKDMGISVGSYEDGVLFYDGFSNDSLIGLVYDRHTGTNLLQIESALLQFPLNTIPSTSIINSARLEVYGYATINIKEEIPTINLGWIKSYWTKMDISWFGSFDSESITSVDFINKSINSWYSFDATYIVQDWVNGRKENWGFILSSAKNKVYGKIYSGDHPYVSRRPKLVVSYY